MKNSKHTPGPWKLGFNLCDVESETSPSKLYAMHICKTQDDPYTRGYDKPSDDECVANARLISAAPQMLEALKSIEYFVQEDFANGPDGETCAADSYRSAYKQLLAAIKLAECD